MTGLPRGVRELDHTADTGIEVEAPDIEALFDRAARVLLPLGGRDLGRGDERGPGPPGAGVKARVSLEAGDAGELLVRWLSELLFRLDARGEAYRSADLRMGSDAKTLEADVTLDRLDAPGIGLKSVTYHGLECARDPDGRWRARVIFDV